MRISQVLENRHVPKNALALFGPYLVSARKTFLLSLAGPSELLGTWQLQYNFVAIILTVILVYLNAA